MFRSIVSGLVVSAALSSPSKADAQDFNSSPMNPANPAGPLFPQFSQNPSEMQRSNSDVQDAEVDWTAVLAAGAIALTGTAALFYFLNRDPKS